MTPAEACQAALTLLKDKRGAPVSELAPALNQIEAILTAGLTSLNTPEVMTVDDLAGYLQVGAKVVYKMANAGDLPSARVGDQWRFKRSLIDRWLEDKAKKNVSL